MSTIRILLCIGSCVLLPTIAFTQHTLILKDGQHLTGKLTWVQGGMVNFFTDGRPLEVDLATVRTIHFYDSDAKADPVMSQTRKAFSSGFDRIEYIMDGRSMTKFPKIVIGNEARGVVVVDVAIDKYGNVISAEPGAAGSKTTDDKYLFYKAKFACQEAKFDTFPTAPLRTEGKIFVVFK
ncbi:MAG: hypothetical protein K9J06_08885 [Flavobacteriales bacterium]|nr:hypothetical protein [Flavobacteriales bacterium]